MSGETYREGGCGCYEVRYAMIGEPIFVNNCHCRLCQQQTGSTSVVNMFIEAERIKLVSGTLIRQVLRSGSGQPHQIHRCRRCGCAVWSAYPRFGTMGLGVRVGTLDDPTSITPDAVIFTQSKMPWVTLPQGIPAFATTYNPAELLPPERLARLTALAERCGSGLVSSSAAPAQPVRWISRVTDLS